MPHYVDDHCGCEVDGDGSKAFPYKVDHLPLTCRYTIELVRTIQTKQRQQSLNALTELKSSLQDCLKLTAHPSKHLIGCDPEEGPAYCMPTCRVYR